MRKDASQGTGNVILSGEMRALEQAAFDAGRTTSAAAMERAGQGVARAVLKLLAEGDDPGEVLVLCGPGNNGGDGYVVARLLHDAGHRVRVLAFGRPATGARDATANLRLWQDRGPVGAMTPALPGEAAPGVIVDAIFGIGLTRRVPDAVSETLASVADRWPICAVPRVAVDLPSGLDADTGEVLGTVLPASVSVTFHRAKPVHLIRADLCGQVDVVDIGL